MNRILERVEEAGGSRFIQAYQPSWEKNMQARGFRLRSRRVPVFLAVAETPLSARLLAAFFLPHLTRALHKVLTKSLALPASRKTLLASLLNRQELQLVDIGRLPRPADLFGRFDTFLREENGRMIPTIIEANFNNVEGLLFNHVTGLGGHAFLAEIGLGDAYQFESALWHFWEWMLERYRQSRAAPQTPTIGIVWQPGHMVKDVELPFAAEYFRRWGHALGIEVVVDHWGQLDYSSRLGWTMAGRQVQVIWKNAGPFYPQGLTDGAYGRLSREAPQDVCVVSDILGRLLGSKWLLEGLWNPANRHLFNGIEWQAIKMMVPWTAEIRDGKAEGPDGTPIPDMLRWLSQHKDELVIKPVLGSHGLGVYVGMDSDQSVWDAALGMAGNGRWIAMQYVQPEVVTLPIANPDKGWQVQWHPLYTDCNFYVFGGRTGSVIRRASKDRILNVAQETPDGSPAGGVLIAANAIIHE